MEEIADAAGVTKPVLYQHFGSKRMLYLELLETVGEELLDEVAAGAAAETDPYQRVLAGFRAYFRFVAERTSAFQLLFGSGARLSDEFADAVRHPGGQRGRHRRRLHRRGHRRRATGSCSATPSWAWARSRPAGGSAATRRRARLRSTPPTRRCWPSGCPIWSGPACAACREVPIHE